VKVDSRPDVIPETHEKYLARINREVMARREKEAQELAKRTEGLEDGNWRDPCGIIRDRQGKTVLSGPALEQKLAREAAHDKAARAEDLAYRRAAGIPILHGADDAGE
jgi:GH24 family phage-related lysozyme (muramidase)